jgi:hypothetical protein
MEALRSFYRRCSANKVTATSPHLSPFNFPLNIFKFFGVLITRESSWKYIIFSVTSRLLFIDLFLTLEVLYLPRVGSIVELTKLTGVMASFVICWFEIFVLYANMGGIERTIADLSTCIEDFGVGERFERRLRRIQRIATMCLCAVLLSGFMSSFPLIFSHTMPYLLWTPLNLDNSFNFWLVFTYETLAVFNLGIVSVALELLPVYFMVYIVGFVEQLCERLEGIKKHRVLNADGTINQAERIDNRKELVTCVKLHVKIHQITKRVSDMFAIVFLARGIITCILICSTTFSVFATSDVSLIVQYISYITYIFVQLFIPCCYGNKIIEISSKISTTIGHSEWMLESKEYRQLVRIILEFSKKPMKFNSFGLFDVNLEIYSKVCQSAYTLFTVCERLNDK